MTLAARSGLVKPESVLGEFAARAAPARRNGLLPSRAASAHGHRGEPLATAKELSDFLASVERRAFKQCVFAVQDEQSALDIVQDAMLRLAEKYSARPAGGAAAALPAHPAERHPRPLPPRRRSARPGPRCSPAWAWEATTTTPIPSRPSRSNEHAEHPGLARRPARAVPGHGGHRGGGARPSRSVNARPSCCVTGRNSMSARRPRSWDARRAA